MKTVIKRKWNNMALQRRKKSFLLSTTFRLSWLGNWRFSFLLVLQKKIERLEVIEKRLPSWGFK
jgi:hypothetical protein